MCTASGSPIGSCGEPRGPLNNPCSSPIHRRTIPGNPMNSMTMWRTATLLLALTWLLTGCGDEGSSNPDECNAGFVYDDTLDRCVRVDTDTVDVTDTSEVSMPDTTSDATDTQDDATTDTTDMTDDDTTDIVPDMID